MATSPAALTGCSQCKAVGLPILPVRYAVVPKKVTPALPAWVSGARIKDVKIGDEFTYALRSLRAGYLYLFYSKNARGSQQWECYSVGEDGCLILQPDPQAAQPQSTAVFQCARHGKNNIQVQVLVIERPEMCGPTWIAYSPHKWSNETLKAYASDAKKRDARMQTLQPPAMAAGTKHSHGELVSQGAIESVLEYAPQFNAADLPHDGSVRSISKDDGTYNATVLKSVSTLTPWHLRSGQAAATAKHMVRRATEPGGKQHGAHVVALWDAIGIAHELNGYRNDAAGQLKQYGDERALQITAINAVEGLKQAIDRKITDNWDKVARTTTDMPDIQENSMRMQAVMRYAKDDPSALGRPLANLDQQYKAAQISEAAYKTQRSQVITANSSNPSAMEAEYARIDQRRAELADARARNLASNKQESMTETWSKYRDLLDWDRIRDFKKSYADLLKAADTLIDGRTQSLIGWLEAPLFIDTLEDFHPACDTDGVAFEDTVGNAIFGMGSCQSGAAKIEAWVNEAKASIKTNLVWRAIAMNQDQGIAEVDAALKIVYGAPVPLTTDAWEKGFSQIKWNKVFDLGKKSLTAFNTQAKAFNDPASGIRPLASLRGLDKVFLTVGGYWVRPFKWSVDTLNEVTLRTLLMVRSGVEPLPAKALGAWDAVNSSADFDMLVRRLKNQDYFLSAAAKAQYEEHAKKWAALRGGIEVPDAKKQSFNAARDARLALIVAVFEAFNLYKASEKAAKQPGNEKVQAQLTAAQLATSAAAIDVLSNMVKGLAAAGDKAASYQLLKLGGGALSVVASSYGAVLDFKEGRKEWRSDDYRIGTFYFVRCTFQGVSVALTALTALSYCSPLIETFGKRFGERLAGKIALAAANRLLLARAALVFASLEVSIFLLVVTLIVWWLEDDALQKWCKRSAFGNDRKNLSDAYQTEEKQTSQFYEALKEAA